MVDSKRYNPSNKRFQEHTQHFVEGTTKKGHLNTKKKNKGTYQAVGILQKIEIQGIYSDGWLVSVEKKSFRCYYGDNIVYLPPYTKTDKYYVPKKKCEVLVEINDEEKINTILRINDKDKQVISMTNDGVKLEGSGLATLSIKEDEVTVSGTISSNNDIKTSGTVLSKNDIKIDTKDEEGLPDSISVKNLYKQVQDLKSQLSDKNDSE